MNKQIIISMVALWLASSGGRAATTDTDSVAGRAGRGRLSVGGYGEMAMTRNFYSDNVYRYSDPKKYANDPSHGRFDIPHAVIYIGYDFGKGWVMSSEIEFEHTGTGCAQEKEFSEGGEWEQEIEKGGEVELEQFWIQKTFCKELNVRAGHIIVPVGLLNAHHEPLNFFTVHRPEGEATILPSTWHDTGISVWGRAGDFRYEAMVVAGLDAFLFNRENWIQNGAGSASEFKVANKYGFAARIDNYTVRGLRIGLSGYYGRAMHNSFPHDLEGDKYTSEGVNEGPKQYDNIKGTVAVGSADFTFKRFNWIVQGNIDYGYVSDAATISSIKRNLTANNAPYEKTPVGKNALAYGIEAGYDIFSQCRRMRADGQRMYVFGRYEYYNPYIPSAEQQRYEYTAKTHVAAGINWMPVPQIVVKAEWSRRFLKSQYNDEPSISLGIAYQGFFM
ncbi:MAG: hypothetical protein ACI3Y5_05315 [Prevotella sp.]